MSISIREMCRISRMIEQRVNSLMNIPTSEIESEVYEDIYNQAMHEAGTVSITLLEEKSIKAVENKIKEYKIPFYLSERINQIQEAAGVKDEN